MKHENIPHCEIIEKDGTVTIPSIFMFEDYLEVTQFLNACREANCTVVLENENIEVLPSNDDAGFRAKVFVYSTILANREIGNAYLRYLGSIDKMNWDNVDIPKEGD